MTGEGRDELERYLQKDQAEREAQLAREEKKREEAQSYLTKVKTVFLRTVLPALDDARDLLRANQQSADTGFEDEEGVARLVLVATVDSQSGRLIFAAYDANRQVEVNCVFAGKTGEQLGRHSLEEITAEVVRSHLDYFYRGLLPPGRRP